MGRNGQKIDARENLVDEADNIDLVGTFLRIAHP